MNLIGQKGKRFGPGHLSHFWSKADRFMEIYTDLGTKSGPTTLRICRNQTTL